MAVKISFLFLWRYLLGGWVHIKRWTSAEKKVAPECFSIRYNS